MEFLKWRPHYQLCLRLRDFPHPPCIQYVPTHNAQIDNRYIITVIGPITILSSIFGNTIPETINCHRCLSFILSVNGFEKTISMVPTSQDHIHSVMSHGASPANKMGTPATLHGYTVPTEQHSLVLEKQ